MHLGHRPASGRPLSVSRQSLCFLALNLDPVNVVSDSILEEKYGREEKKMSEIK